MSEKPKSPESAGNKHSNWLETAKKEGGSLFLGVAGAYLGKKALMLLGIANPLLLLLGAIGTGLAARAFAKKNL